MQKEVTFNEPKKLIQEYLETRTVQIALKKHWNLKESANSFYPKSIFIEVALKCGKIPSKLSSISPYLELWDSMLDIRLLC